MRPLPSVSKQIVVKLVVSATTILFMLGVGEVVCRIQSRAMRTRILAGRDPKDPWHPNAKGHRLIAETLFPSLKATVLNSERFRRLEKLK
jgi:hypothetical protein